MDTIRFLFAYTAFVKVGGHNRQVDFERLGPSLVIAASLVLAIRTAKKAVPGAQFSKADWDKEIDDAVEVAHMVLTKAIQKHPGVFQHKSVPWFMPDDQDVPE